MPLQIGITGGIGVGKSLVSRVFSCLGAPVYDADSRAKYVMTTDGILLSHIKKEFGELSFHTDGSLNRTYLSEIVFKHPERLFVLNELVHPRVAEDYKQWLKAHNRHAYVIKEAALLFESGAYKLLDKIIVVHAPEPLRVLRVQQRDTQRSESQVREIIAKQLPEDEKLKRADAVILNDESQLVIPQVLALHKQFISTNTTNTHEPVFDSF